MDKHFLTGLFLTLALITVGCACLIALAVWLNSDCPAPAGPPIYVSPAPSIFHDTGTGCDYIVAGDQLYPRMQRDGAQVCDWGPALERPEPPDGGDAEVSVLPYCPRGTGGNDCREMPECPEGIVGDHCQ